jgi:hypothetical protein
MLKLAKRLVQTVRPEWRVPLLHQALWSFASLGGIHLAYKRRAQSALPDQSASIRRRVRWRALPASPVLRDKRRVLHAQLDFNAAIQHWTPLSVLLEPIPTTYQHSALLASQDIFVHLAQLQVQMKEIFVLVADIVMEPRFSLVRVAPTTILKVELRAAPAFLVLQGMTV